MPVLKRSSDNEGAWLEGGPRPDALEAEVDRLRAEVTDLREKLERVCEVNRLWDGS